MKTRFALLLCVVGVSGYAQTPGTFTATGSMITGRFGHTATLLPDGRVLIAGGYTNGVAPFGHAPTAAAELYDPDTGTFTATGKMTSARAYHTATLLRDGKVLIAAGSGGFGPSSVGPEYSLASAELYDPSTGTFAATGDMTTSSIIESYTATLLPDGRVLITGVPFTADLYDPGMGTFTATGSMTAPPPWATATLLPDGRVLLASYGGSALYDSRTGTFSPTGTQVGYESQATLLTNGKVLVAGGNVDPGPHTLAEVYDPSVGIFVFTGNMIAPRANHTATLLPDGKALITGGSSWTGWGTGGPMLYFCCLSSAELYDTATGQFVGTGSMTVGRAGHTATLLNSGNVLIAGGAGDSGVPVTAELYYPVTPIPAPMLLSLSGDGTGQGAIQHAGTYRIASPEDPAGAGEYLSIYLTGLADASVIPPQVAIGGRQAEITFFGNVPGYLGLNVVNVRMPSGVAPGPTVPVRLNYLGRASNAVTIGVQ